MNEWRDLLKGWIVSVFDRCFMRQEKLRKMLREVRKFVANTGTNGEKRKEDKWSESLSEMGKAVRAKSKKDSLVAFALSRLPPSPFGRMRASRNNLL
jgi:hypothetical protein